MKKIILFVVLATFGMSVNSCSSDDSSKKTEEPIITDLNPVGTLTFKVGGATKTFNNFIMEEIENENRYHITGRIGTGIADIVEFYILKDATGTTGLYPFTYRKNNVTYQVDDNFTYFIETNSNHTLVVSFTGGMWSSESSAADITLTNGVINITY